MKIIFIRHGETLFNADGIHIGGQSNHLALTEKGIEQARECGRMLEESSLSISKIYCSTSHRALQTLQEIKSACPSLQKVHCILCDQLLELSQGEWEGQPRSILTPKKLSQIELTRWEFAAPGGESMMQVASRMMSIAYEIYEKYKNTCENVLVISHGNAIKSLLCLMSGCSPVDAIRSRLFNCHCAVVSREPDKDWVIECFNIPACNISHAHSHGSFCSYNVVDWGKNGFAHITWDPDKGDYESERVRYMYQMDSFGLVNSRGDIVYPCLYDIVRIPEEGFAELMLCGDWAFGDDDGHFITPFKYTNENGLPPTGSFSEGLACVCDGYDYGYIDVHGDEVIPCEYDDATSFKDGLASVCKDGEWFFIDHSGEKVTPDDGRSAYPYEEWDKEDEEEKRRTPEEIQRLTQEEFYRVENGPYIPKDDEYASTPFDWYNFISQEINSNALIQMVLKFPERLNYRILRQAYVCCLFNEPILSANFRDCGIPYWKKCAVYLDYVCLEANSEDYDYSINEYLAEPLNAKFKYPVQFCLINGNNLVIKIHHALCDGASAIQFVKMLAQNYSFLYLRDHDYFPQEKPQLRDTRAFYKFFGVADDRESKEMRLDTSLLGEMTPTWGVPVTDADSPQTFCYQALQLSAAEIESLKAFAAANESTLNAVLTAAYHRALVEILHLSSDIAPDTQAEANFFAESTKEIQFTANLRQFSSPGTEYSLSNFSNIFNIQLPISGDFPSLVRETSRAIAQALEPERVLQTVLASELMTTNYTRMKAFFEQDWAQVKASSQCTPMISNLGLLSPEPLMFGDSAPSQMYVVSPAFTAPAFMLSVSTYGGIMTLCASYRSPSLSHDFVRELLAAFHRLVREMQYYDN